MKHIYYFNLHLYFRWGWRCQCNYVTVTCYQTFNM